MPNFPELKPREDLAIDIVASVINKAHEMLGKRQNLECLAQTREQLTSRAFLSLVSLQPPLARTGEKFIKDAIEKTWKLTKCLMYHLKYLGGTQDECCQYYYFEAIFSQPSAMYPIPQTTCSVFFTVEDKLIEHPTLKGMAMMKFRIEGHRMEYDVRYTRLIADWILGVMQMKRKIFMRIEKISTNLLMLKNTLKQAYDNKF